MSKDRPQNGLSEAAEGGTGSWQALKAALLRFFQRDGAIYASHVALAMMLALFPFAIFSLSLTGMLLAQEVDIEYQIELVFGAWPDEIAKPITDEVRNVLRDSGRRSLAYGLVLAVFFAANGVDAVRVAITKAYRDTDPRPFWRTQLLNMTFVFGGGIILTFVTALTVAVPLFLEMAPAETRGQIGTLFSQEFVRVGTAAFILFFAVSACHLWLPGHRRPFKQILPGVMLTLVLWVIAGQIFGYYITNVGSYSVTYAGLAGVLSALVFMYLMAAILILGAEFNGRLLADGDAA